MSAGQEIERKFLVEDELPSDLGERDCEHVSQGYVAIDPNGNEVRVRRKGDKRTLGIKSGPSRTRVEEELELDARTFDSLWALTDGRRIEKRRYSIPAGGDAVIELDVYEGALIGLVTAEVEFPSEAAADAFAPPAWLGTEVTGDARYSNQALAARGRP